MFFPISLGEYFYILHTTTFIDSFNAILGVSSSVIATGRLLKFHLVYVL